jgi:hypothetical protein
MPHIDDGILHAYLDGALGALADAGALPEGMTAGDVVAHLERCADCHSRLDMERATRERAGIVLRDASPAGVHTPPFAPARARARRSWLPLAWAASLIMAAGAGWWGSQLAPFAVQQQSVMESTDIVRPEADPQRSPGDVAQPAASTPPAAPAAPGAASPAESRTESPNARSAVAQDTPARSAPAERAPAQRAPAQTALADVANREPTDTLPRAPAQAAVARNQAAEPGRTITREAQAAEAARPIAAAPPPPVPLVNSRIAPERPAPSVLGFSAGAVESSYDADVRAFLARDSAGLVFWREANASQQRELRPLMFGFAGAADIAFDVALEIGVRAGRVRQRLVTGAEVEVITWEQQQVGLEALVVTADARDSSRAEARRAAVADKAADLAEGERLRLTDERTLQDGRVQRSFAAGDRRIIVRSPSTHSAQDVADRLRAGV